MTEEIRYDYVFPDLNISGSRFVSLKNRRFLEAASEIHFFPNGTEMILHRDDLEHFVVTTSIGNEEFRYRTKNGESGNYDLKGAYFIASRARVLSEAGKKPWDEGKFGESGGYR